MVGSWVQFPCQVWTNQPSVNPWCCLYIVQLASRLSAAHASRRNGSTAAFGTLSGHIPASDARTPAQINATQDAIKKMQRAASKGDWDTYHAIQQRLKFQ